MKTKKVTRLIATSFLVLAFAIYGNAQALQWAKTWNSAPTSGSNWDVGYGVTYDASGNVYAVGIANSPQNSNDGRDEWIEVIKYSSAGAITWKDSINGGYSNSADLECGYQIAVDGSGNVWIAAVTFDSTSTFNYKDDLTLIKLNSSGVMQTNYPKHWKDTSGTQYLPLGCCLTVYDATHVYIGGSTYNYVTDKWAFIVLKDSSTSGWGWNGKAYKKSGTNLTGAYEHRACDLKVNSNNTRLYVTGWICNTSKGKDIFTASLAPANGAVIWTATYSGASHLDDVGNALDFDPLTGSVFVAGYTTTSNGKDAILLQYSSSGTFLDSVKYNNSTYNKDEEWVDIAGAGTSNIYVGGYVKKTTSPNNEDYLLCAYKASDFTTASGWTNPVTYDGSSTASELTGTDEGHAIELSKNTNVVFITGRAYEYLSGVNSANITTIGYSVSSGAKVWGQLNYDYGSDNVNSIDQMFWKYGLATQNYVDCNSINQDYIYVEGDSWINHSSYQDYDYTTLKYWKGTCTGDGPERQMNNAPSSGSLFYPNPFLNSATLVINSSTVVENAKLNIYDMYGKLVAIEENIVSNTIEINRGKLCSGIYYYQIIDRGIIITNGKFAIVD